MFHTQKKIEFGESMMDSDKAPIDLFIKMHSALVAKNYCTALNYCNAILNYEQNETVKKFHGLLLRKLDLMKQMSDYEINNTSSLSDTDTDTDFDA